MEAMLALIFTIAVEIGVPPEFAQAIAITENWTLNPNAMSKMNSNGTRDLGIMQLNSKYYGHIDWRDPRTNIKHGCLHIKRLIQDRRTSTLWSVALAYNCGLGRINNPPPGSVDYADKVIEKYGELLFVIVKK